MATVTAKAIRLQDAAGVNLNPITSAKAVVDPHAIRLEQFLEDICRRLHVNRDTLPHNLPNSVALAPTHPLMKDPVSGDSLYPRASTLYSLDKNGVPIDSLLDDIYLNLGVIRPTVL